MHTKDIPMDKQEQLLSDTKPPRSNSIARAEASLTPDNIPEMPDHMLPDDQEDPDDMLLTFGKYAGKTPNQVAKLDPHWLVWAFNNVTNRVTCTPELANECSKAPRPAYKR